MYMRKGTAALAITLTAALLLGVSAIELAEAEDTTAECADLTIIFARGSGQVLDQREAPKFLGDLRDRLDGLDVNTYELCTEELGGATYRAVGVDPVKDFANLVESEASWAGFLGGQYRSSVSDGVTELTSYLSSRRSDCPDEQYVLGGYSQGAQVVGDVLESVPESTRDKVAFVALFGDPKLYLPEGRGPFPPACRGSGYSKWRRGNVSCFTDNGILDARKPYLSSDIEDRAGSWCDRDDPICNNNYLFDVTSRRTPRVTPSLPPHHGTQPRGERRACWS
jgi:hypothetical protein